MDEAAIDFLCFISLAITPQNDNLSDSHLKIQCKIKFMIIDIVNLRFFLVSTFICFIHVVNAVPLKLRPELYSSAINVNVDTS